MTAPHQETSVPEYDDDTTDEEDNDCKLPRSPDDCCDAELPTTTTATMTPTSAAGDDDGRFDSDDGGMEDDGEGGDEDDDDDDDNGDDDEENDENERINAKIEDMDASDLLAMSKTRLGGVGGEDGDGDRRTMRSKTPATEDVAIDHDDDDDDDDEVDNNDEKKIEEGTRMTIDQAHYVELAIARRKLEDAELRAKNDADPEYLQKLAERKVREAQARALADEMSIVGGSSGMEVATTRPTQAAAASTTTTTLPPKPARSDNSELWALLNYSKMRLETGSTPQVGGKRGGGGSGSKNGSIRGDDAMSVSSKLSKSSKLSMGSSSRNNNSNNNNDAPFAVVGYPGGAEDAGDADAPPRDVNDAGDASVDGSVSLESATKNDGDVSRSDSDEEEEDSSVDDDEEEEELPDFLKDNDDEHVDPEEARALYEAAKFKAASILSVTKRSLFKLNEAKVEDLKAFLNFSSGPAGSEGTETMRNETRDVVGWGIGRGRLLKKLGAVARDFKDKCSEIDERTQRERVGQPTGKDMINAAMLDLKVQIEEYEKIMTGNKGP